MFKAVSACSTRSHENDVIADLISEADRKLGIYRPSAGILYASCVHEARRLQAILRGISRAFPGIEIIGCTVVGGFTEESGYIKDGYLLCLLVSDTAKFITGRLGGLGALIEKEQLTSTLCRFLQDCPLKAPSACLFFSAYAHVDGEKLINGLQDALPEKCRVFGGVATDYWSGEDIADFSRKTPPADNTLLFFAGNGSMHVEDDSLVFLLFGGNIKVESGISLGWSDTGMLYPGRAEGSILTELDGKDPHAFLREMKHPLAAENQANTEYALWFHVPGSDPFLRDIFFNAENGTYHTQGSSLPAHFNFSFSFPRKEAVLEDFQKCIEDLGGRHDLVIATTCCGHQVVLEQDVCSEYFEMVRTLPRSTILCGYFFGEFGPVSANRRSMLHSCSSVLLCLGEEAAGTRTDADSLTAFLDATIKEQSREIKSLQKQLRFFEESKMNKQKKLSEDCLGILLCRSHKSLSGQAEQISNVLREYYRGNRKSPPYATSRNRVIEHLAALKKNGAKILSEIED